MLWQWGLVIPCMASLVIWRHHLLCLHFCWSLGVKMLYVGDVLNSMVSIPPTLFVVLRLCGETTDIAIMSIRPSPNCRPPGWMSWANDSLSPLAIYSDFWHCTGLQLVAAPGILYQFKAWHKLVLNRCMTELWWLGQLCMNWFGWLHTDNKVHPETWTRQSCCLFGDDGHFELVMFRTSRQPRLLVSSL